MNVHDYNKEVIWILSMRFKKDRICIKFNHEIMKFNCEIILLWSGFVVLKEHISVVVLHI